jgi:hypothetical protein
MTNLLNTIEGSSKLLSTTSTNASMKLSRIEKINGLNERFPPGNCFATVGESGLKALLSLISHKRETSGPLVRSGTSLLYCWKEITDIKSSRIRYV